MDQDIDAAVTAERGFDDRPTARGRRNRFGARGGLPARRLDLADYLVGGAGIRAVAVTLAPGSSTTTFAPFDPNSRAYRAPAPCRPR